MLQWERRGISQGLTSRKPTSAPQNCGHFQQGQSLFGFSHLFSPWWLQSNIFPHGTAELTTGHRRVEMYPQCATVEITKTGRVVSLSVSEILCSLLSEGLICQWSSSHKNNRLSCFLRSGVRNQPTNHSINQSINQSVGWSINNQSINHPITDSIDWPTNQSISQSINQSVNQSVNQSIES